MFYHIIMKNFKSNLKNYILFFVSNILAIAELFAFWGLNDVVKKAVKDGVTAATLKSDFVLAAGLITFITVFVTSTNQVRYNTETPYLLKSLQRLVQAEAMQ